MLPPFFCVLTHRNVTANGSTASPAALGTGSELTARPSSARGHGAGSTSVARTPPGRSCEPIGHLPDRIPYPTVRHPDTHHLTEELLLAPVEIHPLRPGSPNEHLARVGPEPEQLTCHVPLLRPGTAKPIGNAVHHTEARHRVIQGQPVPRCHPSYELSDPHAHLTGRHDTSLFPTRTHRSPQPSSPGASFGRPAGNPIRSLPQPSEGVTVNVTAVSGPAGRAPAVTRWGRG